MGGSSKSQTIGYRYCLGMHCVFTHGPVDKITRLQFDKRSAWEGSLDGIGTISVEAKDLFGGDDREGGVSGLVDFMPGEPTQNFNPYLQAQLGQYLPAFRGVSSLVFRGTGAPALAQSGGSLINLVASYLASLNLNISQFYFGNNPYLKPVSARMQRIHKAQDGATQWYDAKAAIPVGVTLGYEDGGQKYRVEAAGSTADYSAPDYDDSGWDVGQGAFGNQVYGADAPVIHTFVSPGIGKAIWIRNSFTGGGSAVQVEVRHDDGAWLWWNGEAIPLTFVFGDALNTAKSIATIPASKVKASNVAVLKVMDAVPSGNPTAICAGLKLTSSAQTHFDMNPAHIIRECLTNADWGMGYNVADVDDVSFTAAADQLYSEGMGISLLWDRQTAIEDFVKTIIQHIDAALYVDRKTGKFTLKLIRNDYDVDSLIILNEDNIDKVEGFKRAAFGELTNSVTVNYWDYVSGNDASLTIQDIALSQMQGATINTTLQYPGFSNGSIASRAAQRDLKTLSTPLVSCTIYANRDAAALTVGSVFKWTWPDYQIENLVMRVTGVAYGDGRNNRIRLTCVQDIFSLPETPFVNPSIPDWTDPNVDPTVTTNRLAMEVPYLELVQREGQTAVDSAISSNSALAYAGIAAGRPTGAINARVLSDAGAGYEEVGTLDYCPTVTLGAAINQTQNVLPISAETDTDIATVGSIIQFGLEMMAVTELGANYIGVKRGVLDTVPIAHNAGEIGYIWDAYLSVDSTEYASSESINFKLLTKTGLGELPEASAPVDTVALVGRAAKPYPPGNFQINSQYFPAAISGATAFSYSWAHRDRTQQTGANLVGFADGNVGPETSVTYTLRFYGEAGSLGRTVTGLTSASYTYLATDEQTDFAIPGDDTGDVNSANIVSLLLGNGADGGTTITDEKGITWTRNGVTTSVTQVKFGTASLKFNAGNNLDASTGTTFDFSGDFTWRGWVYFGSSDFSGRPCLFTVDGATSAHVGHFVGTTNTGKIRAGLAYSSAPTTFLDISGTTTITANTFHYIEFSKQGNNVYLFLDGNLEASATGVAAIKAPAGRTARYGKYYDGTSTFNGYMDDVCFLKGVCVHTASYTPPSREASALPSSSYRLNGKIRVELEAVRGGIVSFTKYNQTVYRTGYAFNYGMYYGDLAGFGNYFGNSYGV